MRFQLINPYEPAGRPAPIPFRTYLAATAARGLPIEVAYCRPVLGVRWGRPSVTVSCGPGRRCRSHVTLYLHVVLLEGWLLAGYYTGQCAQCGRLFWG